MAPSYRLSMRKGAIGLALVGLAALASAAVSRPATPDSTALLARYEPVVELYRTDWKPTAVEPFLAGADLERLAAGRWQVVRRSPPASALAGGSSRLRLDTRSCTPAVDLDRCYVRKALPATVYGRAWVSPTASAGIRTVLQYWFFYPLDDWRNSLIRPSLWHMHEGDWEEVSVALDAGNRPLSIACSQHDLGVVRGWTRVRVKGGSHPVVYVALGSHANYLSVGFHGLAAIPHVITTRFSGVPLPEPDFTSSQTSYGPAGSAPNALGVVDISDGTAPWLSFAGPWGDGGYVLLGQPTRKGTAFTHLRVGDSPPGPTFHAIWRDPLLQFRSWPADDGH
jgi:hypothetical protein